MHANVLGCDFRGANLEETSWGDNMVDRSVDIRGARLINVSADDRYNPQTGALNWRGVDWTRATFDETTQFGTGPDLLDVDLIDVFVRHLKREPEPLAPELIARLHEFRAKLLRERDSSWYGRFLDTIPEDRRASIERLLDRASKDLL